MPDILEWGYNPLEQVRGVEPPSSAWKADVLSVVQHLQIVGGDNQREIVRLVPMESFPPWWALRDSNPRLSGYEPETLTN